MLRATGGGSSAPLRDNELYDGMRHQLREESNKRLETLKFLHEYGLFFTQRGLSPQEFSKPTSPLKTVPFKHLYADLGFTRCNICLTDFNVGEKVKQFPQCDHLFHTKCLDLWTTIDARCPNCLRSFNARIDENQVESSLALQKLMQDQSVTSRTAIENLSIPNLNQIPQGNM